MKNIVKLILSLCFCFNVSLYSDTINGQVCTYKFSNNLKYISYNVSKKAFVTNKIDTLKTYDMDINTFEINTDTNEFAILLFSNNTLVKVNQNSEFRVDGFEMSLDNTNSYPSRINVNTYNMNLALMEGEAYFVIFKNSKTDQLILQTPVSNLGLEVGKYYIQSSKKSVLVYILEGTLDVYDNVTNKKETIKSNNAVLINPPLVLSPKQRELFGDKANTSVKKPKEGQFKPFLDVVNEMELVRDEVIFISVDNKIVGAKVK